MLSQGGPVKVYVVGGLPIEDRRAGAGFGGDVLARPVLQSVLCVPFEAGGQGLECQVSFVWPIGSMLPEMSKYDDDFERTAG